MKKILLICLPILLYAFSSLGQSKEGLIVNGVDTFAVVKISRIDSANVTKVRLDSTIQQVIELNNIVSEIEFIIQIQDSALHESSLVNGLYKEKEKIYTAEIKQSHNKTKWLKFLITPIGVTSFILGYSLCKSFNM